MSPYYRVNMPTVTHQTIDGEVVIVNLETGSYYSLQEIGATIWSLLESGAGPSEIVARIQQDHHGDPQAIENGVRRLICELYEENLIMPASAGHGEDPSAVPPKGSPSAEIAGDFKAPVLQKYTDMKDLLLLDPIHEVDETGWPNIKEAA